jgi:broad specificity phosphatase PhoE
MQGRFATTVPLVFLRHGETDWNIEGRFQGHRDIPLNDLGRAQAHRNGEAIAEHIPNVGEFDFFASPLVRARETMEIVRGVLGLDPATYRLDRRLMEISYGKWEGLTGAELNLHDPEGVAARAADRWRRPPPGGESYRTLFVRVGEWLAALDRPTVTIAHGGVGRVLRAGLLGIDPVTAVTEGFPQDKVFLWIGDTETSF